MGVVWSSQIKDARSMMARGIVPVLAEAARCRVGKASAFAVPLSTHFRPHRIDLVMCIDMMNYVVQYLTRGRPLYISCR